MKQPLPAKYSKMTVCTFWLLKQLKSMDILSVEQMDDMVNHFQLFKENEDQMLVFRDLVENFKEHENYLKMYTNAKKMDESDEKQTNESVGIVEEKPKKKIKDLTEAELIKRMLDDENDDSDSDVEYDNKDEIIKEETLIKIETPIIEKKQKIILKIMVKK